MGFNSHDLDFLEKKLKIDLVHLSGCLKKYPFLKSYISENISIIVGNSHDREDQIHALYLKTCAKENLKESSPEHNITDNMRYDFRRFKDQSFESLWYNKEVAEDNPFMLTPDQPFGNKDDLDEQKKLYSKENKMKIFRGMSLNEYKSKSFHQSWTLDKEIAEKFAYVEASDYPMRRGSQRCVAQAFADCDNILSYSNIKNENEVVIKSVIDLSEVSLLSKKQLPK